MYFSFTYASIHVFTFKYIQGNVVSGGINNLYVVSLEKYYTHFSGLLFLLSTLLIGTEVLQGTHSPKPQDMDQLAQTFMIL